jgi:hypothetical protein
LAGHAGGFVRIAEDLDARAINLQQGGRTADAWILSDKPSRRRRCCRRRTASPSIARPGALPSRAASNLFWLGRYVERTEATLPPGAGADQPRHETSQTERDVNADIVALLSAWEAVSRKSWMSGQRRVAATVLQQRELSGALPFLVGAAQSAASGDPRPVLARRLAALTELVEMIRAPFEQGPNEARSSSASMARSASSRPSPVSRRRT